MNSTFLTALIFAASAGYVINGTIGSAWLVATLSGWSLMTELIKAIFMFRP